MAFDDYPVVGRGLDEILLNQRAARVLLVLATDDNAFNQAFLDGVFEDD